MIDKGRQILGAPAVARLREQAGKLAIHLRTLSE